MNDAYLYEWLLGKKSDICTNKVDEANYTDLLRVVYSIVGIETSQGDDGYDHCAVCNRVAGKDDSFCPDCGQALM